MITSMHDARVTVAKKKTKSQKSEQDDETSHDETTRKLWEERGYMRGFVCDTVVLHGSSCVRYPIAQRRPVPKPNCDRGISLACKRGETP